jgi:hypothetical protein
MLVSRRSDTKFQKSMDKQATLLQSRMIPQTTGFTAKCGTIFFEEI